MALIFNRYDNESFFLVCSKTLVFKKVRAKVTADVVTLYMGRNKIATGVDRIEVGLELWGQPVVIEVDRRGDAEQVKVMVTADRSKVLVYRDDYK